MSELAQQATGAGSAIGRYFNVVSSIPSLLFVSYLFILIRSGAWSGPVNLDGILDGDWWKGAIFLSVLGLALALALHPLQFTLIQFLEGYWGTSTVAIELASLRLRHHRARLTSLRQAASQAHEVAETATEQGRGPNSSLADLTTLRAALLAAEAGRATTEYPEPLERVLPTRLGNVLRRHELAAGRAYGLDAITTFPRVAMLAPEAQLAYVQDQRLQLELAVRVTVLSLAASVVTAGFMCWHGWWVLLALAPYALAYLSYRGAVVVAGAYGSALALVLELNRFTLYDQFRLPLPTNTEEERQQNEELMRAMKDHRDVQLTYRPSDPSAS